MKYPTVAILFLILINLDVRLTGQDTLLLFHPTVDNVRVIQELSDNNTLELTGIHVLGVYHAEEKYDYDLTNEFLAGHPDLPFTLSACECELSLDQLYGENGCTSTFLRLFQHSVGALFMGGPDMPPGMYREPVHLLTVVTDPFRHFFEASYLFHLLGGTQDTGWSPIMQEKRFYLVSGICLGMQTMNVSTGGTLIQDIPTELYHCWSADQVLALPSDQQHRNYADKINVGCEHPTSYHFHRIRLNDNTFITNESGINSSVHPQVLSSHHQSVEQLGKGWRTAATSMDGKVIEAIEHTDFPHVFAVQFHPEKPGLYDQSIRHARDCIHEINFMEKIAGTPSYEFHIAYWRYLGSILQEIRSR